MPAHRPSASAHAPVHHGCVVVVVITQIEESEIPRTTHVTYAMFPVSQLVDAKCGCGSPLSTSAELSGSPIAPVNRPAARYRPQNGKPNTDLHARPDASRSLGSGLWKPYQLKEFNTFLAQAAPSSRGSALLGHFTF